VGSKVSNEIALRDTDSWVSVLEPVGILAKNVASTDFVPKALRGNPAAVAACILTGREIGLGPMESLAKINMIDGKPSLASELMRSLVLRAGHQIKFSTLTDMKVTIEGRRAGEEEWTVITWTTAMAATAGVGSKDVWKKYPRAMLSNRATSELCRLIFPDALGGLSYTAEELEEEATTTLSRTPNTTTRVARVKAEKPVVEEPELDTDEDKYQLEKPAEGEKSTLDNDLEGPPLDTEPDKITEAQVRLLGVLFKKCDLADRDAALAYVAEAIGRKIESRKELSKHEASLVINRLQNYEEQLSREGSE
jgi:hypothetical protein